MLVPLILLLCLEQTFGAPFLFNLPETLANFASSASASASSLANGNIADFRQPKSNKLEVDDDFFKDLTEPPQPNLFQNKLDKITQKFQFLAKLVASSTTQQPDQEFSKEEVIENLGYNYPKPMKLSEETTENQDQNGLNPGSIGIFFVELLGSLVGLVYGAAAQLNHQGTTTTPTTLI